MSWVSHYDSSMRFLMTGDSSASDSVYLDTLTCSKEAHIGMSAITSAIVATAMWLFD